MRQLMQAVIIMPRWVVSVNGSLTSWFLNTSGLLPRRGENISMLNDKCDKGTRDQILIGIQMSGTSPNRGEKDWVNPFFKKNFLESSWFTKLC